MAGNSSSGVVETPTFGVPTVNIGQRQAGRLLCANCAAKEGKACNLDKGALFAVRYICLAEDKKLFAFRISEASAEKLFATAEQYALHHMDKTLNSLKFLRSLPQWDPDYKPKKGSKDGDKLLKDP